VGAVFVVRMIAHLRLAYTGVDYTHRETHNALIEVEWMSGESGMTDEEYEEQLYRPEELRPETGGRYFRPRLVGAGYHRQVAGVGAGSEATGLPAAAAA